MRMPLVTSILGVVLIDAHAFPLLNFDIYLKNAMACLEYLQRSRGSLSFNGHLVSQKLEHTVEFVLFIVR